MSIGKCMLMLLMAAAWSTAPAGEFARESAITPINAGVADTRADRDAAQLSAAAAVVARAREKCAYQPEPARPACLAAAEATLHNAGTYVE